MIKNIDIKKSIAYPFHQDGYPVKTGYPKTHLIN
jgi:hypothetical protein